MPLVPPYDTLGDPFEPKKGIDYAFQDDLTITSSGITSAYNLTDATVRFHLGSYENGTFTSIIDEEADVVDEPGGRVRYVATAAELDLTPGNYLAEWEITFAGGDKDVVPRGRTYRLVQLGTLLV